jgi:hypothetical protein
LMTCFYFIKNYLNALMVFVVIFILLFFVQLSELGLYFTDRLIINDNSSNITTLTYLQGWSDMVISLEYSDYLGVGFQNMGTLAPSAYGETIYALTGVYKNREDGGFLAAKIVSEFGFLGVVIILFYLKYFFRSIKMLWQHVKAVDFKQHSVLVFSNGVIVAFAVELFARGYGYFSPGFILVITSVMISATTKRFPTFDRRGYK